MIKVMVIEDDQALARQIAELLISNTYQVIQVTNFKSIEESFKRESPDLVVLDINLPYYDGNYYCRRFRRVSNVPIIIISARDSDVDQILSMELGADEYVQKGLVLKLHNFTISYCGQREDLSKTEYRLMKCCSSFCCVIVAIEKNDRCIPLYNV